METCLDLVLGANRSIDARTTFIFDATRRFGGKTSTGRKDFLFAPDCPASVVLPGVFSCHSGPALGPSASAEVPVPVAEMRTLYLSKPASSGKSIWKFKVPPAEAETE